MSPGDQKSSLIKNHWVKQRVFRHDTKSTTQKRKYIYKLDCIKVNFALGKKKKKTQNTVKRMKNQATDYKKIFQITFLIKALYLNKELFQFKINTNKLISICAKDLRRPSTKENLWMVNKPMKDAH